MALQYGRSRLPELLKEKGMSQAEFARRMNKTAAYVSQIISGNSNFSLMSAKKAALILDCTIDDLYEWESNGHRLE